MQVLYAPYQSRSVSMEPRQRGQLRGGASSMSVSFMSSPWRSQAARGAGEAHMSRGVTSARLTRSRHLRDRTRGASHRRASTQSPDSSSGPNDFVMAGTCYGTVIWVSSTTWDFFHELWPLPSVPSRLETGGRPSGPVRYKGEPATLPSLPGDEVSTPGAAPPSREVGERLFPNSGSGVPGR
jgi:hypothetical protein